ncbi:hypothetical protein BDR22DRAFT_968133 [Usnea florida]
MSPEKAEDTAACFPQHNEHHTGDSYRQTDSVELDSEKSAFNSTRMENSRRNKTEKRREYVRPENLDDIMHAVDALQSQLDSPDSTTELSYPYYHALSPPLNSPASTNELSYSRPPSSTPSPPLPSSPTIPIAELDAHDTAIPPPSPTPQPYPAPTPTTPPPFPLITQTTPLNSHPPNPTDFIINPTTPLNSHPPTPSERSFARALHTARPKPSFEPHRPPPPRPLHTALATYDAMTSYRESLAPLTAKRALASVVNSGFGGVVAMAARVSQKRRARREKKGEEKKKTKMSFSEAVNKGFKGVFGEREERGR